MAGFIIWPSPSLKRLSLVLRNLTPCPCRGMDFLFKAHCDWVVEEWLRYRSDSHPPPCWASFIFMATTVWRPHEGDRPPCGAWQVRAGVLGMGCGGLPPRIGLPADRLALAPCKVRHFCSWPCSGGGQLAGLHSQAFSLGRLRARMIW